MSSDEYSPFTGGPRRAPPTLVLLETCWRVVGPSGKPITCGIYRTDAGLEVRCQYSPEDLVRSQFASHIDIAQDIAAAWKRAAIDKGFAELRG